MKKCTFILLLAAVVLASCEQDVVPLPTTKEYFTVSSTKRVRFAKGNLQHHPDTDRWRMAGAQYDHLTNPLADPEPGWVDLFVWQPEEWSYGQWRALTADEWRYLLDFRTAAPKKRGLATIGDIQGLVLLPDGWQTPAGVAFLSGATDFVTNSFTFDQWTLMETAGAIFLPAAGNERDGQVSGQGLAGYYWSSSPYDNLGAWNIAFHEAGIGTVYGHNRAHGYSIRLVQDE